MVLLGYSERNNPMFIEIIEDITERKLQLIEIEKQKKAIDHMTEVICLLQGMKFSLKILQKTIKNHKIK